MTAIRREGLPGRSGVLPASVALMIGVLAVALLGFSPTLSPIDLLAGRVFEVAVPDVTNMTQTRALVAIDEARLVGDVVFRNSAKVSRGLVVRQTPVASETARRGSTVVITVSSGPVRVTMPDFVGDPEQQVMEQLEDWEITPRILRVNDERTKAGQILSQSVAPGAEVLGGSALDLGISLGPVTRPVPELAGLGIEGAAFRLGQSGFLLGEVMFADDASVPSGGVVSTDPPAGAIEDKDTPVDLVISSGRPPLAIPAVTGRSQTDAAAQLTRSGFVVGEISQIGPVDDPQDGRVLDQNPAAGTVRRPGEVVTLTVRRAAKPPPTTQPPPVTSPDSTGAIPTTTAPSVPGQ